MSAPTPTARVAPTGLLLPDGYQSLITFASNTSLSIWEMSMTPPGMDFGDPINITTQQNALWRTFFLRQLISLTKQTIKGAYDPAVYTQFLSLRGRNDVITQKFYDGTTVCYYGGIVSVEFGELVEGTFPDVTVVVQPTNRDASGVEQGPVVTSVSGT